MEINNVSILYLIFKHLESCYSHWFLCEKLFWSCSNKIFPNNLQPFASQSLPAVQFPSRQQPQSPASFQRPTLTLDCAMRAPCAWILRLHTGVSWPWQLPCHRRAVKSKPLLCLLTNSATLLIILNASFLQIPGSQPEIIPGATSALSVLKENPKEYLMFQCYAQDALLKSWSLLEL